MGGRVLAFNENGEHFRPVLVVRLIDRLPQVNAHRACTVFAGAQVLLPDNGATGVAVPVNYQFAQYFAPLIGKQVRWAQMRVQMPTSYDLYIAHLPRLPLHQVKEVTACLIAAGNDPIKGFWLQFEGHVPLFDQPRWWEQPEEDFYGSELR